MVAPMTSLHAITAWVLKSWPHFRYTSTPTTLELACPRGQCYTTFYCGNLQSFHGIAVILSYYCGNYHKMAVNYPVQNANLYTAVIYHYNILWYLNPRKCRYCSKLPWYFYHIGTWPTVLLIYLPKRFSVFRGSIFSFVRPSYERAVSNLDP